MYSLTRESDGAGDSGSVSLAIWQKESGEMEYEHNAKPRVGVQIQVGSQTARSYSSQDYWQTTYITEILEDGGDSIRFKTGNSIYIWVYM